jgi:drug/metabolite transporter (DMT)-like permease
VQSYNFKLGLLFISTAVAFWGVLPTALKLTADFIDPISLTWLRFIVAFVVSLLLQTWAGNLNQFKALPMKQWGALLLVASLLLINYISFVYSLDFLAPSAAQLNFQTAPFFLALGGLLFFKERLSVLQLLCFATLALGMILFFQPLIQSASMSGHVWTGVIIIQISALSWSCYALLQRSLIAHISPGNILLFVYGFGLLVMTPFTHFEKFSELDNSDWQVVLFCAFNTVVAYGCFAQSMKYWPTIKVGAMIALTPLISFLSTALVVHFGWWPQHIFLSNMSVLTGLGIALIVASVFGVQLLPGRRSQ